MFSAIECAHNCPHNINIKFWYLYVVLQLFTKYAQQINDSTRMEFLDIWI